MSPLVREFGLWNVGKVFLVDSGILGNLCLWDPESWALNSRIQLKEAGVRLTIGIWNPNSTDRY